jgi:hypothetical protein
MLVRLVDPRESETTTGTLEIYLQAAEMILKSTELDR